MNTPPPPPAQGEHTTDNRSHSTAPKTPSLLVHPTTTLTRPLDIAESLRNLHDLFQLGGLTLEEFATAKERVLQAASAVSHSTSSSKWNRKSHGCNHHSDKSKRSRRNSSSSSSSSSSSNDRFIVVPRTGVWRNLERTDHQDLGDGTGVSYGDAAGDVEVQSPLSQSPSGVTFVQEVQRHHQQPQSDSERAALLLQSGDMASQWDGSSHRHHRRTGGAHVTVSIPQSGSENTKEQRERPRYGTFFDVFAAKEGTTAGGSPTSGRMYPPVSPEHEVHVRYFNCRGATGTRFSDVLLKDDELRPPVFLNKRAATMTQRKPVESPLPMPSSQVFHTETVAELTEEERRAWAEMTGSSRTSSSTSSSRSDSFLEQSLNWYWVDATGRDPSQRSYNSLLRYLTRKFGLCKTFLVNRDHAVVMPQFQESPIHPGQYMLSLRVATHKISISDDSVLELTNRWFIIVDLNQHVVITLHRIDTHSMALLRSQWTRVMTEDNDVSFQEFLLKIIDDAISTYQLSLDVHADLLDKCESKLFAHPKDSVPSYVGNSRILHHFASSSRSPFLRQLLDDKDTAPMNKGLVNTFLHHLHRRTSVQYRLLNLTESVLALAFTRLHLCSKELANQMCVACIDLSDKALEVRDDAKTLLDLHISLQTFRTNELMAVLTRVSVFFTPCTFLAGVYGMNFRFNFPELDWQYGYPVFWGLCAILVLFMQFYFVRGTS